LQIKKKFTHLLGREARQRVQMDEIELLRPLAVLDLKCKKTNDKKKLKKKTAAAPCRPRSAVQTNK
jgi:hypothetical protein